ncbi:hypothetical protein HAX54_016417, partial [Datura stramonium]|nr:hypothetical protein [Datura stramonium]
PCHATIAEEFCLEWNLAEIPVKVHDGTMSRSPCSVFTSVTRWEDLAAHLEFKAEAPRYPPCHAEDNYPAPQVPVKVR